MKLSYLLTTLALLNPVFAATDAKEPTKTAITVEKKKKAKMSLPDLKSTCEGVLKAIDGKEEAFKDDQKKLKTYKKSVKAVKKILKKVEKREKTGHTHPSHNNFKLSKRCTKAQSRIEKLMTAPKTDAKTDPKADAKKAA